MTNQTTINWNVVPTSLTAKLPTKATDGSNGYDLYADEAVTIGPDEWKLVSTGLSWSVPDGTCVLILPRSGLAAKHGVTVLNSPGLVDTDYRGIVKVILINHSKTTFTVNVGERIAQALQITPSNYPLTLATKLSDTARGEGGFGHSGK